jgi:hypothetical protein
MTKRVRSLLILAAVAVLFFLGLTGVFSPKGHAPAGQPAFVELEAQKMESLRQAFNAADSDVRIVVWAAPT